jgi:hypothetical protein
MRGKKERKKRKERGGKGGGIEKAPCAIPQKNFRGASPP